MLNVGRTIQHTAPNTELCVVACIDEEEETLYGVVNLLELSNPTVTTPICVHALHMLELVARANPLFIDHNKEDDGAEDCRLSSVHNALKIFGDCVKMRSYTSATPKRSMHQDVCELALSKQACFIIVPIPNRIADNLEVEGTDGAKQAPYSLSYSVLNHAPCSVGVLVTTKTFRNRVPSVVRSSTRHFVLLFLGGPDSREALFYAERITGSPDTSLTVIRFLAHENQGDVPMEKKIDDQLVTSFWVRNEANERIGYREAVVRNGQDTMAVIQAMNNESCDLWIVGRSFVNPTLLQGLSNWSGDTELGVVGEYVASADFASEASVLVVQQQVLRGQNKNSGSLVRRFLLHQKRRELLVKPQSLQRFDPRFADAEECRQ